MKITLKRNLYDISHEENDHVIPAGTEIEVSDQRAQELIDSGTAESPAVSLAQKLVEGEVQESFELNGKHYSKTDTTEGVVYALSEKIDESAFESARQSLYGEDDRPDTTTDEGTSQPDGFPAHTETPPANDLQASGPTDTESTQ